MSDINQFVCVYHILFHYFLPLKVVRGCGFWCVFNQPVIFCSNHMSSEMWCDSALMPVAMKFGTIHYVMPQGQLCHVLQ